MFPPAMRTEFHDEKHQPNLKDIGSIDTPLAAYVDQIYVEPRNKSRLPMVTNLRQSEFKYMRFRIVYEYQN